MRALAAFVCLHALSVGTVLLSADIANAAVQQPYTIAVRGSIGDAVDVHVSFATKAFLKADVNRAAEEILKKFGHRKLIVTYFDHNGFASGYAYPAPSYVDWTAEWLFRSHGRQWPFTTVAQMIATHQSATIWYRHGTHVERWNVRGTNDTSLVRATNYLTHKGS
jgi:hypothetical protein